MKKFTINLLKRNNNTVNLQLYSRSRMVQQLYNGCLPWAGAAAAPAEATWPGSCGWMTGSRAHQPHHAHHHSPHQLATAAHLLQASSSWRGAAVIAVTAYVRLLGACTAWRRLLHAAAVAEGVAGGTILLAVKVCFNKYIFFLNIKSLRITSLRLWTHSSQNNAVYFLRLGRLVLTADR